MQRLGKHIPAAMNAHATIDKRCFICGPCREVITMTVDSEFCTGGCEDRTWEREAEESPQLEAVARERLLKT
jgi:uncharacterized CHY-type Zn-finger protein